MSAVETTIGEPAAGLRFRRITVGDPAPWFYQRSTANPRFAFHSVAGRYVVLCFLATAADEAGRSVLAFLDRHRDLFDDDKVSFFGVSLDPTDESEGRLTSVLPGIRHFWDHDASVSALYGAAPIDARQDQVLTCQRLWFVLDPTLRVVAVAPFSPEDPQHERIAEIIRGLPPPGRHAGFETPAPILYLPNVFEPDLCRQLVGLYETNGGEVSGFMREVDGKTVVMEDADHKSRADYHLQDPDLIIGIQQRVRRRIVPEIQKVHQFQATRMERYIVARYAAEERGHFRPHRDNTTKGTAHRRFAVSINLNDDYEGGDLVFPEYGQRTYKPAPGAALVFSCSMLHAVTPMLRGRRYVFLPFLYDEAASKVREANNGFLGENVAAYRG